MFCQTTTRVLAAMENISGRVVQNDRVRHFNGRFRTEAAHCHADTGHGEYRGVVDAVTYKKYGLPGAERFQLGGLAFGEQPGAVLVEMQFLGDDGGAFGAIARQHDQPFNTLAGRNTSDTSMAPR